MENLLHLLDSLLIQTAKQRGSNKDETTKSKTKEVLLSFMLCISRTTKEDLPTDARQHIDSELVENIDVLKWPLLRALEDFRTYRGFLGLPKTLESTRQSLTRASRQKISEIFNNLNIDQCEKVEETMWVGQVLSYLSGDGKRKKELNGFVLLDKGPVRAAFNRVSKQKTDLLSKFEGTKKTPVAAAPAAVEYEMERDVRLVDQERNTAKAEGFSKLMDEAFAQRKG